MAVTDLGKGIRFPLTINEGAWNTGKLFSPPNAVKFFQRAAGGTNYTLTVFGRYRGTAPVTVQVRTIDENLTTVIVDWATLDAAPASNGWTGTTVIPVGQPSVSHRWKIQVRDSANPGVVTTSYATIVVGVKVACGDQSNGLKKFGGLNRTSGGLPASAGIYCERGSSYTDAYPINAATGKDDPTAFNGVDGFGGDGQVTAGNQWVAVADIPICFKQYSIGSTTVITWETAANGGTHTSWDNVVLCTGRQAADVFFEAVYGTVPAETDGVLGTAKATYKTAVVNIHNQWLTLSTRAHVPLIIEIVGRDISATAANMEAMRQGQLEVVDADATGDVSMSIRTDQYGGTGLDPHFWTFQYDIFGCRLACELLFRLGFTSVGMKGPKCASITASAVDQSITLTITPDGGTGLTDSAGNTVIVTPLTPFRVFNGAAQKTISTTAFTGATTIKFTVPAASFIPGDTINLDHMFGQPIVNDGSDGSGNCVYDNLTIPGLTLGRPLQPSRGQLTCVAGV